MTLTLQFPDDLAALLGGEDAAAECAQADLAVHYYRERRVSLGKAAEMSGLPRWEFEQRFAGLGIERDDTEAELEKDIAWAFRSCPVAMFQD